MWAWLGELNSLSYCLVTWPDEENCDQADNQ